MGELEKIIPLKRVNKEKNKAITERVCMIFDMDGTLTEPWYGEKSPSFYMDEEDAVLRSSVENTYTHVKPLPYIEKFLNDCDTFFPAQIDFKCLTRIVNGKEYLDKVDYIESVFSEFDFEIMGAVSEEDKLIYLRNIANGDYDKVYYFDDTISTLNLVGTLKTKTFILGCHATALLTRTVTELYGAWYAEKELNGK